VTGLDPARVIGVEVPNDAVEVEHDRFDGHDRTLPGDRLGRERPERGTSPHQTPKVTDAGSYSSLL